MKSGLVLAFVVAASVVSPAQAQEAFPFGFELTLDVPPMPGSKRIPSIDIGESGEARVGLWCTSASGQFSVAGNSVVYLPGPSTTQNCTPAQTQADGALTAALGAVSTWRRQGEVVTFAGGSTPLRFRINTN